ncbi:MAG: response regulator [Salinivirgaceae bacterium]|nr:response regulator [Salinivirgaceae bacterium]
MNHIAFILIIVYALAITAVLAILLKKMYKRADAKFDYNNVIQKKTSAMLFDLNGILISDRDSSNNEHVLSCLHTGDHISAFKPAKDIETYLNTCIRHKRNVTVKIERSVKDGIVKRIDLIFSPFKSNGEIKGIIAISQEMYAKDREAELLKKATDLAEQNTAAQEQISQLDAQRSELELAFKKSSKHHIKLQKAMYRIEQQKQDLENALSIINEQKSELERVNAEIKKSNQMKEIFLANTSHEIRTPLNAIIGFTNLLLKMNPDEYQLNYLNNIKNSGNNLLFIINDILDLSKIEAGKMDLESTGFDVRDMVSKIVSTLSVKRDDKDININVDIDARVPEVVVGDPYRITQVLTNLVNNSIKFTGAYCQIDIVVRLERIVNDDVELVFKVSDNGIGIPKDKQNEIFQSFTQANKDTTRKYGGTGLGLSITKQLVEMYHGHISVESEEGKGSTFTFNLILKMADSTESAKVTPSAATPVATDRSISILLVEDNEINQQLATDTIKAWNSNTQIDIAGNGQIAVDKVKSGDYDLILMDIQMPVMDGNTAAKIIRQLDPPKNQIPIIAMTAHAFKEERERCFSNGMNDYVMKPFDSDDLCSKIYKYAVDMRHEVKPVADEADEAVSDEPFNLDALMKICGGKTEELSRIVGVYAISIPSDLSDLATACRNKDIDTINMKTHSLKTSFGYLGMSTAVKMIVNLGKLLADNPDSGVLPITQIADEWERTAPLIKEYVKQLQTGPSL